MPQNFSPWCLACGGIAKSDYVEGYRLVSRLDDVLDYVIEQARKKKFALLYGAGISVWPPTNMLTG
jgi:hypothetical protein